MRVSGPERAVAVAGALVLLGAVAAVAQAGNWTRPPCSSDAVRQRALLVAQRAGDDSPTGIAWVHTTRNRALRLVTGSEVSPGGEDPVRLVRVTGRFRVAHSAPSPGRGATHGEVIWFTIGSEARGSSFGVGGPSRDLAALGQVCIERGT